MHPETTFRILTIIQNLKRKRCIFGGNIWTARITWQAKAMAGIAALYMYPQEIHVKPIFSLCFARLPLRLQPWVINALLAGFCQYVRVGGENYQKRYDKTMKTGVTKSVAHMCFLIMNSQSRERKSRLTGDIFERKLLTSNQRSGCTAVL